jgi:hypothetical protein
MFFSDFRTNRDFLTKTRLAWLEYADEFEVFYRPKVKKRIRKNLWSLINAVYDSGVHYERAVGFLGEADEEHSILAISTMQFLDDVGEKKLGVRIPLRMVIRRRFDSAVKAGIPDDKIDDLVLASFISNPVGTMSRNDWFALVPVIDVYSVTGFGVMVAQGDDEATIRQMAALEVGFRS